MPGYIMSHCFLWLVESNGDAPKPQERYIPPEPSNDEATIFGGGISCGINFDKYDNIRVKVCINAFLCNIFYSEMCVHI